MLPRKVTIIYKMLHELLLALQGCSGNVISLGEEVTVNRLPFISPLEEQVLI